MEFVIEDNLVVSLLISLVSVGTWGYILIVFS